MPNRSVFFVSDGTGITAETFGNSILAQFGAKPRHVRRPFIDTVDPGAGRPPTARLPHPEACFAIGATRNGGTVR